MDELIAAIVFNLRSTLKNVEKLQEKVKGMEEILELNNGGKECKEKMVQKLKEATSVQIIFNDLFDEIEKLMVF